MSKNSIRLSILLVFMITLSACSAGNSVAPTRTTLIPATQTPWIIVVTATPLPATSTPLPATATPTVASTTVPSPTATILPTLSPTTTFTPTATSTNTPAATVQASNPYTVKYLVLLGTNGPTGCGDSLFPVSTGYVATGDIKVDVTNALNSLFATGTQYVGNLYNPLYRSKFTVAKVEYIAYTKNIIITLAGNYVRPPTDCDKLRYRAQVWETIRQFEGTDKIGVWLSNGKLLGDLLVVGDN